MKIFHSVVLLDCTSGKYLLMKVLDFEMSVLTLKTRELYYVSSIGQMDRSILFIYANRFKGIETGF